MLDGEKIYVLTSGSYSDYNIVNVFSSKEKAGAYLAALCDRIRLDASKKAEELKKEIETGSWKNGRLARYYEKYPKALEESMVSNIKISNETDEELTEGYDIEEYWLDPAYGSVKDA